MIRCWLLFLLLLPVYGELPTPPAPDRVVVVYNSQVDASGELARHYAKLREIPEANLVGLPLVEKEEITREYYEAKIRDPLIAAFDKNDWWRRVTNEKGSQVVVATKKNILVTIRGVPSRISATEAEKKGDKDSKKEQMFKSTNAAVDSELTLLGHEGYQLEGGLNNPYFKKEASIIESNLPILLVGRIDGPSHGVSKKLINDAIEVEQTGLWGMAYFDVANKDPEGDLWIKNMAAVMNDAGFPTYREPFNETFPTRFPLRDTAFYIGWYDWNVSGPFKENSFHFKKGAIAVHLHSFSASQLRDPKKNWCAPLLARGAAATLGNTYEPFLQYTHHLDVFGQRLMKGYTLVEAAYMSMPVLSWQGVVLGDPLYRPFTHLDGSGKRADDDRTYRALRIAKMRWGLDAAEWERQLRAAATRMNDPRFLEAIALDLTTRNLDARASAAFLDARHRYEAETDKLRMDLYNISLQRRAERKAVALQELRTAEQVYASLPEVAAVKEWLKVVDPPAKK